MDNDIVIYKLTDLYPKTMPLYSENLLKNLLKYMSQIPNTAMNLANIVDTRRPHRDTLL